MKCTRLLIIVMLFANLLFEEASAQQLTIGNKVPDVAIKGVSNYGQNEFRFSDLRGRLVILDFWNTKCGSCIKAFPDMEKLQKMFPGRLQVFTITQEPSEVVNRFLEKKKKIRLPDLPAITGDTLLSRWFPQPFVPWHVWIDSAGVVQHITQGFNATPEKVSAFLAGKKLDLIDLSRAAFKEEKENKAEDAIYYSMIKRCDPLKSVGNLLSPTHTAPSHLSRNCASISELYRLAYSRGDRKRFQARNTLVVEIADSANYLFPTKKDDRNTYMKEYSYSYELKVPQEMASNSYKIMQQDLERYFGISARIEKRRVPCWVLTRTGSFSRLMKGTNNIKETNQETFLVFQNKPMSSLITGLQRAWQAMDTHAPLVDATNYTGTINLALHKEIFDDICSLQKELRKFGLNLVVKDRITEVLVLYKVDK